MPKNNRCTTDTLKHLMRTMSLLLQAHFIKPWLDVRYCILCFMLDVNFIVIFRLTTAISEKLASPKYDVANSIRIWRALQCTSENLN